MKKTTNAIQAAYMLRKAHVEALKAQAQKIEQDYMRANGIVDENGETPAHVWCIDDEATFDRANLAVADDIDALGIIEAEKALKAAEDALINYGLSLMPSAYSKEREQLRNAAFGLNGQTYQLNVREKIIDYTMKLDVSTVPSRIA